MVAGDRNRAAVAYIGTTTPGSLQAREFPGVWHMYISTTYDGGNTWHTVNATPNDPVQRGPIWLKGGGEISRNLLDFMDATIDREGRVLVGFADGCTGDCVQAPNSAVRRQQAFRRTAGSRLRPCGFLPRVYYLHMKRASLLLLLLLAIPLFARTRAVSSDPSANLKRASGATVSGIVSSVNGNLIQLAGGLVTIDATGATVIVDRGKNGTVADIESGMLLFATLKSADAAANAPLAAEMITATRFSATTFFGPVQSVDTASSSFKMLGRTIFTTSETSFGGVRSLAELLPNTIAQVQVDVSGGRLVATSVLVVAPNPPIVLRTRGTVKSIAADSWVITREREGDLTLVVNAQTKILGEPKVGDTVEVVYSVDSANANIALSIVKFEINIPTTTFLRGKVKTIAPTAWTIISDNQDVRVLINDKTKIMPGIAVGDTVEVLAQKNSDGTLTALLIGKLLR